jgi:hypothetical protein
MDTRDQALIRVAKFLDSKEIEIRGFGRWRLIHRLSGKLCIEYHAYPFEAVTVYICEKVVGEDAGQRAIVKVRVEYVRSSYWEVVPLNSSRIPITGVISSKNPKTPWPISKDVNAVTEQEKERLIKLTKAKCTSTPRFMGYMKENLEEHPCLPGGYVAYILMQLVPGVSLENFWERPRQERDQARKAFVIALE